MTSPARPAKKGQFDPMTPTSPKDCAAALAAYKVRRETGGRVVITHKEVREYILATGGGRHPDGTLRGLTMTEVVKACAHWGVDVEATKISPSLMYETAADGAPVGVIVSCPTWTIFPGSTYRGAHEIYLHHASEWPPGEVCACEKHTATRHREYTVEDPGSVSAGYVQRSAAYVERAAQAASGNTGMWVHVGQDTEGVYRTVSTEHWAREQPSLTAKAVKKLLVGQRIYTRFTTNQSGGEVWYRLASSYAQGRYLR